MARITPLPPSLMDERQQKIHSEIAGGRRGTVPAPLEVWLRSPELADRAQKLGEFARYGTSLPPRLSELAILVTARFWTAHYEWAAHKIFALKAGLDPVIIADIAARREPKFNDPTEVLVYEFSQTLHREHKVKDELYQKALEVLGEKAVVELVGILGYYTLISMTLNVFEIEVPTGSEIELQP